MESIGKNSKSDSNLHAATDKSQTLSPRHISLVPSFPSSFQKRNIIHNHKRPKSFPCSSKSDFFLPTERRKSLSELVSKFETIINDSQNNDNSQINIRMHGGSAKNILPGRVSIDRELHISTDPVAFSETNLHSSESSACHRVKVNTSTVSAIETKNLLTVSNSVNNSLDTHTELKFSALSLENKKKDIRIVPEHLYEEIDETDHQCTIKCSEFNDHNLNASEYEEPIKFDDKGTSLPEDAESVSPVNQRWCGNQGKVGKLANETSKPERKESNAENEEDELWKNYTERPLLPLKPLQKQRSMSCVNLVQTIKGFSKKKSSSNNKHSSPINNIKSLLFPENSLIQKKDIYTSEANISELGTELVASADLTMPRMNDTNFTPKITRQSLLPDYAWFHPIDAKEASKRLLKMQQNGAFLIRPASNPTSEVLHTLCVMFSRKVYNFHVKSLKDGRITLGKRKGQEETFSSLLDMIKYHQIVPISINSSECNQVSYVYLLITPPK